MEIKEQSNQNPEQGSNSAVQDEKPETAVTTVENEELSSKPEPAIKLQISDTEKGSIVDMMQNQILNSEAADEPKLESTSQISDVEKSSIVDMMQNQVSDSETVDEPKLESISQISDAEKNSIVDMIQGKTAIADTGDKPESKSEISGVAESKDIVAEEKETGQISNAERLSIIFMLRGKADAEEHEIVHADIDFDQLNKQELVD
ncbi:MAG: hypothetical protein KAH25_12395, partial [Bacteroidales bacterium]|nr:hypothetical protein [Bacteroidales bacterium]